MEAALVKLAIILHQMARAASRYPLYPFNAVLEPEQPAAMAQSSLPADAVTVTVARCCMCDIVACARVQLIFNCNGFIASSAFQAYVLPAPSPLDSPTTT